MADAEITTTIKSSRVATPSRRLASWFLSPVVGGLLLGFPLACRAEEVYVARLPDPNVEDDDLGKLAFYGILATSPVWAPKMLLQDDYQTPGGFYSKPYRGKEPGHMSIGEPPAESARRGMFTVATDYGRDSDMGRYGANLTFDSWMRIGFDAEANWIDNAEFPAPGSDFQTGDVNLSFRFAQHEKFQFRLGAGMRWLADEVDDDYGPNVAYSIDWQPLKPIVVSTVIEGGVLRDEGFSHFRTSIGVAISHVEILGGFDYLEIGPHQFAGPFAGLRVWY